MGVYFANRGRAAPVVAAGALKVRLVPSRREYDRPPMEEARGARKNTMQSRRTHGSKQVHHCCVSRPSAWHAGHVTDAKAPVASTKLPVELVGRRDRLHAVARE